MSKKNCLRKIILRRIVLTPNVLRQNIPRKNVPWTNKYSKGQNVPRIKSSKDKNSFFDILILPLKLSKHLLRKLFMEYRCNRKRIG
jgi:hypothetical protein